MTTTRMFLAAMLIASCAAPAGTQWHDLPPPDQAQNDGKADGPSDAHLTYHGGPVIPKVKVWSVYWGANIANQTELDAFYAAITNSAYFDWLSEYNTPTQTIARGSFGGTVVDAQPLPGTTVTDAQVQAELGRLMDAGTLPPNDANNLYMVHFPDGVTISTNFGSSCSAFCAYHGTLVHGGKDAFYGVMPGCGQTCTNASMTVFESKTAAATHEITEAITDAEIGLFLVDNVDTHKAWFDSNYSEIGDICAWIVTDFAGYKVQKEWSNAHHTCTVTGNDSVTDDFQVSATPLAGVVSPGGSTTFNVVTTLTSGMFGNVAVSVTGLPAGVTATFSPSGPIGQTIALQVHAASTAAHGTTTFSVTATATDTSTSMPVTHQVALQLTVADPAGLCSDGAGVRSIAKPAAGTLVITELLADPSGIDTAKEWFEITNTGATAFDLNGLGLQGKTGAPNVINASSCISIAPGQFGLLARSADPGANGMLPPVDATFGFSLTNTSGSISVLDGATVLDTVTWTSTTSGVSKALGSNHFSTTANDSAASFCPGTVPYGDNTNKGTPKAPNATCP